MAEITVPLSRKGIADAKKFLLDYKKNVLQQKLRLFVELLAKEGVMVAKASVKSYNAQFTGELLNSIHEESGVSTKDTAIFYVKADSEHAIFVEVGTGIIGAQTQYHGKLPVMYAQGKTIHKTENGKYGWFYQDAYGDWWFTEGMPSRPFMYNASIHMRERIEKLAKEVFK